MIQGILLSLLEKQPQLKENLKGELKVNEDMVAKRIIQLFHTKKQLAIGDEVYFVPIGSMAPHQKRLFSQINQSIFTDYSRQVKQEYEEQKEELEQENQKQKEQEQLLKEQQLQQQQQQQQQQEQLQQQQQQQQLLQQQQQQQQQSKKQRNKQNSRWNDQQVVRKYKKKTKEQKQKQLQKELLKAKQDLKQSKESFFQIKNILTLRSPYYQIDNFMNSIEEFKEIDTKIFESAIKGEGNDEIKGKRFELSNRAMMYETLLLLHQDSVPAFRQKWTNRTQSSKQQRYGGPHKSVYDLQLLLFELKYNMLDEQLPAYRRVYDYEAFVKMIALMIMMETFS